MSPGRAPLSHPGSGRRVSAAAALSLSVPGVRGAGPDPARPRRAVFVVVVVVALLAVI